MKSASLVSWVLPLVISILALADGSLHLALDAVLFRGNFIGQLGPPPGAPANSGPPPGPPIPMPLQLNQMFVANFVAYVLLVVLFWLTLRRVTSGTRLWVDLPLMVMAIASFLAWVDFGRPNPMGLGYVSKSVEILLVIALIVHARLLSTRDNQRIESRREPSITPA